MSYLRGYKALQLTYFETGVYFPSLHVAEFASSSSKLVDFAFEI